MRDWQEEILHACRIATDPNELFAGVTAAARAMGFTHCSYGLGEFSPASAPRVTILRQYPQGWVDAYERQGYFAIDPSVRHGIRTRRPAVWTRDLAHQAPELWEHARSFGVTHGWAQSSLTPGGHIGMLTLAREAEAIGASELESRETSMMWLTSVAHSALSEAIVQRQGAQPPPELSAREKSILGWTVDGKTSADIALLLGLSVHTVNFHFKHALVKLGVPNKAAAVAKAIRLGLLF